MAPKKKIGISPTAKAKMRGVIEGAGEVFEQQITDTLTSNYMPYAMSVIMSRAIPEIDGFKPSHRKLLYTMYRMGLLTGKRTKSANIVGETMKLNPHGDAAIYDTLVRLSRGYEALLHPYVDSKGNFGKFYSRDMAWAASRYTEAKLDAMCNELFRDIEKNTVDFADNYDSTLKEPTLLPAAFPSVLVNANTGIAVGMASNICPFNLSEVCTTVISMIRNPDHNVAETLLAPDFPGGGGIIFDRETLDKIYSTGRGSLKIKSRYTFDKSSNCIDVTQIPPSTTIEAIIEKVVDLVKLGKIKEVSDIRDETGLDGLKITIDLKRGIDPDRLMRKLFRSTPLQDSFSCNFNVLINGVPRVAGVKELLEEWLLFRIDCVKRRTAFDLSKKQEKLHLLRGLSKILLDIDKAIAIVRETDEESEVVPNLMIGFGIDEVQSEYVAEIRLRNLNRQYILRRLNEIEELEAEISRLSDLLYSDQKIKKLIITELTEISKKYGKPRSSIILYEEDEPDEPELEEAAYPVWFFFTKDGYFKKITPQSLRMSGEHKLKAGDEIILQVEGQSDWELLFFTNRHQVYKAKASVFEETKASMMGSYAATTLGMDEGETAIYMVAVSADFAGYMLFFFENGKAAKIPLSAYETKTNRKKLLSAYSDASPLVAALYLPEDKEILLTSSANRKLIFHTGLLTPKTSKNTIGVAVMTLKTGQKLTGAHKFSADDTSLQDPNRYRVKAVPVAGAIDRTKEPEQLSMF